MPTPRTPKKDGGNPAIPDAELVREPGVDALSEPEVPVAMPDRQTADRQTVDPQTPAETPLPEPDVHPSAAADPAWTESPATESPAAVTPDDAPASPPAATWTEPPRPTPAPPRRGSAVPLVIGGIVAAVIGFGVSQVVPQGWPLGSTSGLEATVAAQSAEIARLSQALESLPAPAPPADLTPLEGQLAALTDRIAAAEGTIAAIPAPADPGPRIADLEARLAQVEAMPPGTVIEGGAAADPAAMAALSQELATLRSDIEAQAGSSAAAIEEVNAAAEAARAALAEAQEQAAALTAQAQATAAAASARAALGRIEAAVETGAPFATAVEALTAAGTQVPGPLASAAATGLPTLASLQASFPDAARAALDESLRAEMGDGTIDRLGAFLRSQTGARSLTPREGTDPDAVLSRAEAALRNGDLAATLAEIAALPPAGQAVLEPWVAQAQARVDGMAALATLAAAVEG